MYPATQLHSTASHAHHGLFAQVEHVGREQGLPVGLEVSFRGVKHPVEPRQELRRAVVRVQNHRHAVPGVALREQRGIEKLRILPDIVQKALCAHILIYGYNEGARSWRLGVAERNRYSTTTTTTACTQRSKHYMCPSPLTVRPWRARGRLRSPLPQSPRANWCCPGPGEIAHSEEEKRIRILKQVAMSVNGREELVVSSPGTNRGESKKIKTRICPN